MSDGERLIIAWQTDDGEYVTHDTGLRGDLTVEAGGFVVPFASRDNAIDCLRVILRSLERQREQDTA
jgi:hypothetical protein